MITKNFVRLKPDLIYGFKSFLPTASNSKNTIGDTSSTGDKKRNDPIVISAFQDLFQISLDIFQEFDLDNLISKRPVLAIR